MAHDTLGTFNKSQFDRFMAWARSQLPLVDARILHLEAEKARIGTVIFAFDQEKKPVGYRSKPAESYLGKLLAAYEVLGGDPFTDLQIRLRTAPVFLERGSETKAPERMSNGEIVGARGKSDGPSALLMQAAKGWLADTIQYRFNSLERKIRRALDYSDQLQAEIDNLKLLQLLPNVEGSLENIATQVTQLLSDPQYRAIFDDGGGDPFGRTIYAPFSAYDVAKNSDPNAPPRVSESAQRQSGGFVGPGETGS
jgi:hypothetical protein